MRFTELNDSEKVQSIKDNFILILELLARDPERLKTYFKVEKPKTIVAALEKIIVSMNDDEKSAAKKSNAEVEEKTKIKNEELEKEYNNKLATFEKAAATISKLKKKDGCLCGSCLDLNTANKGVPDELEVLIDIARKEAEERVY
jgi:hypothetical protein